MDERKAARLRQAGGAAIFLMAYLAADNLALPHIFAGMPADAWNIAPAISFGFLVRFGPRWGWLAGLAALSAELLGGGSWSAVLGRAVGEALACALAAYFLRQPAGRAPDIGRLRNIFPFFLAAAGAALAMALARYFPLLPDGGVGPEAALMMLSELFLGHVTALLGISPLIAAFPVWRALRLGKARPAFETVMQWAALALISWEVFGRFVNQEIHFFYLLFLPVAWIAARHGQLGAALALAAIHASPVISDLIFGHRDQVIVELQIRLGVLSATGLLLGAMVGERRISEARMLARQSELAHFQRLNLGWEMASALAHELTQPLTAAMNYTQAALRLLKSPEPEILRVVRIMEKSVDQIERAGQTIHGLRDFMRKGEMRLARNSVAEMTEEAVRLVSGEANAAGIALNVSGLEGLPMVLADKTQIIQVLINLLRNAVQALAAAGAEHGAVMVSGGQAGRMVEIRVADNGPGLPAAVLARIFEPFVTTKEAGMGLGLSVSKSLVEAHGGSLRAENLPHGGAVFRFDLPAVEEEHEHA